MPVSKLTKEYKMFGLNTVKWVASLIGGVVIASIFVPGLGIIGSGIIALWVALAALISGQLKVTASYSS